MRVLVAEDDAQMADLLRRAFEEDGHAVLVASTGSEAFRCALQQRFDVLVLDVMLPGMDGFAVTRKLRQSQIRTPVLMLTARDADHDVVHGLDAGADDYVTKPFSFDVLLARMRALERRGPVAQSVRFEFADLTLDDSRREVRRNGSSIALTPTEFSLLRLLLRRARMVVSREAIIESVWGSDAEVGDNNLDALVRNLRAKIDTAGRTKLVHTVRGIGYCLRESEE